MTRRGSSGGRVSACRLNSSRFTSPFQRSITIIVFFLRIYCFKWLRKAHHVSNILDYHLDQADRCSPFTSDPFSLKFFPLRSSWVTSTTTVIRRTCSSRRSTPATCAWCPGSGMNASPYAWSFWAAMTRGPETRGTGLQSHPPSLSLSLLDHKH